MKFDILPIPQHYHTQQQYQQHYLTIEDIKSTRNSCWLCGCNWLEDHVSLDCSECGGYALSRPCVNCDGRCGETWQRDIGRSHDSHRARFTGRCRLHPTGARNDSGAHLDGHDHHQHHNHDDNDHDELLADKSARLAQLLRLAATATATATTTTTTMNAATRGGGAGGKWTSSGQQQSSAAAMKPAYQQQHSVAKSAANKSTGQPATTTTTTPTTANTNTALAPSPSFFASPSSCCSSQQTSATNSDEDQDN